MSRKNTRLLFTLCFGAYFSAYIGRLNYAASLTDMIVSEGFSKGQAGLIGTGFFFAYGAGQFISGFLGDRLSPKKMVFTGLFLSGLCNLLMTQGKGIGFLVSVWCVNGLVQALIWSPMLRLVSDYCREQDRAKMCVMLNSSVPAGTMAAYGITAAMLTVSGWRTVFWAAGIYLLAVSGIWMAGMGQVEKTRVSAGGTKESRSAAKWKSDEPVPCRQEKGALEGSVLEILARSGLSMLFAALFVQGALKDGVTTWIPVYIRETYGVSAVTAVIGTMVIPLCNLFGVWLASNAGRWWGKDEVKTSAIFFAACTAALAVLCSLSGVSMALSFGMLALSTTTMMAVNTILTAALPSCFGVIGKASSVSGILNSAVYAGGALSTYGIGKLAGVFGWRKTIFLWAAMAAVCVFLCGKTARKWVSCRRKLTGIRSME